MARQNVYTYPDAEDYYAEVTLAGWFDVDKAESYPEGTRWDGQNTISLVAGGRWDHETLYRTSGGRWVLRHWSQWEGRGETWAFINDDAARNWLIRCEYDDSAIAAATGEDMPAEIGRPVIGPQLKVRLPEALIARIDAVAEVASLTRSAWIRQALEDALPTTGTLTARLVRINDLTWSDERGAEISRDLIEVRDGDLVLGEVWVESSEDEAPYDAAVAEFGDVTWM